MTDHTPIQLPLATKEISKADIALKACVDLALISVDTRNGIVYGRKGTALKGHPNDDGYIRVKLLYPDWLNSSSVFVHRIIAYVLWGDELFSWEVNHINENKADNRACNLELVDHDYNVEYSMNGAKNHMTQLTAEQVREIRRRYRHHGKIDSGRQLAIEFGTSYKNISQIIHRISWAWVD